MAIEKSGNKCCGCTACTSVCPYDAITMQPDEIGFKYPQIDKSKCVECGLCEDVCQFSEGYNLTNQFDRPLAYAVRHKNIKEIETSRSGATFIALSDWILDRGGIVYGVGFKNHFEVAHKRAVNKRERDEFKGSKYVQSNLDGIFRLIKDDLKSGRMVLFSGTSCQVSGLKSYVGNYNAQLLYTIDIVCYGVPSPKLWRDYLSYIENRLNKKVVSVDFRNKKKFGWYDQKETFYFTDGTEFDSNTYSMLFQNNFIRSSCNVCPYTNLHRVGDLTLGDYWGWERTDSHFNEDGKGCSLLLVNSSKGKQLFENIRDDVHCIKTTIEKVSQPRLETPTEQGLFLSNFEAEYKKYGFIYVARKYSNLMEVFGDMPINVRIIRYLQNKYYQLKKIIKRVICV
jgi:coenzyme F420-reducing hydrogenase beta subunit